MSSPLFDCLFRAKREVAATGPIASRSSGMPLPLQIDPLNRIATSSSASLQPSRRKLK
jgi:hypothetical protein